MTTTEKINYLLILVAGAYVHVHIYLTYRRMAHNISWFATWSSITSSHGFVHIPKTGGTSIEDVIPTNKSIFHRTRKKKHKWVGASPWHLPVDVYEAKYAPLKYNSKTYCVVRDPESRFESCMRWPHSVGFKTPPDVLQCILAKGRHNIEWTEEYVHRMPQSWFVWADDGKVTCDCVIAYPKLSIVLSTTKNAASSFKKNENPRGLRYSAQLYVMDSLLYEIALDTPDLCYRPRPLMVPTPKTNLTCFT